MENLQSYVVLLRQLMGALNTYIKQADNKVIWIQPQIYIYIYLFEILKDTKVLVCGCVIIATAGITIASECGVHTCNWIHDERSKIIATFFLACLKVWIKPLSRPTITYMSFSNKCFWKACYFMNWKNRDILVYILHKNSRFSTLMW